MINDMMKVSGVNGPISVCRRSKNVAMNNNRNAPPIIEPMPIYLFLNQFMVSFVSSSVNILFPCRFIAALPTTLP